MKIAEIMTTDVQTVDPNTDLLTVANYMKDLDVGVIPVTQGVQLVGVITDRDLVVRAFASGANMQQATVSDFMSANPTTITAEDDVQRAAQIMAREQIRRLPVVDNGTLVGIVSIGDVAVDTGKDKLTGDALQQISQPAEPQSSERGR